MAASKLFTPRAAEHDCFVNPFSAPTGMPGFAPTTTGSAPYPLHMGGGTQAKTPGLKKRPVTTSDDPE